MDKIKLIKEIEHIALTYEFDEVVKDCTYEEFIEDWGKDVYECIYIDYIYNEELEKIIIEDLIYSKKYTEDEIVYIKDYMNGYYFDIGNKEIRLVKDKNLYNGRILPVYNINNIVNQKLLHNIIATVLKDLVVKDFIPVKISKSLNLIDRASALKNIHFPKDEKMLMAAKNRLIFEELFLLQCGMMLLKKITQQQYCGIEHSADGALVKQLKAKLPFALTNDQKKVLREIKADMETEMPMQRLLQGDVGSGKTIIAMLLLVKTVENGYQGALMVPTEILAQQHYNVFCEYLEPLKMKIGLLSSKLTKK